MAKKNILVVAAHPDDEVLGCGGTIARYAEEGQNCQVVILAEGITSRYTVRKPKSHQKELSQIREQAQKVAKILGIKHIEFHSFPDNRMDSSNLLDVTKVIEKAILTFEPDIIFTHHAGDLNIDHRITALAVETATRPTGNKTVSEIYAFEILSSTEWAFSSNNLFQPNYFVDISSTLEKKIKALRVYSSEIRPFPHPRSSEAVVSLAKTRGSQAGLGAAEAFRLIRKIA